MSGVLRFMVVLLHLNWLTIWNRKRAFWMQVLFMLLNNMTFFIFWWMIFQKVEDLNGYRLPDMAMIYGLSAGAWGLSIIFAGGRRQLAHNVAEGQIDPWLAQPKPVLPHILMSQIHPSGIGDLISAVGLWVFTPYGFGTHFFMYIAAMLAGALVFVASGVVAHSLAFWLGPVLPLARQYEEFMIFFSVNPQNVFGPMIRVLIFSALPAGFISYLPVEAIRSENWWLIAVTAGGAAFLSLVSVFVFGRGLKNYSSGSGVSIRVS